MSKKNRVRKIASIAICSTGSFVYTSDTIKLILNNVLMNMALLCIWE